MVDISFETLGGLCTVAFLESIDRKLQDDNIFKRSIILVSPCCLPWAPCMLLAAKLAALGLISAQLAIAATGERRLSA